MEMKNIDLDAEEKDTLDSYDREELKTVKNPNQEIEKLREYAKNTLHERQ